MDTMLRRRAMIAAGGSPTPPPTPTYVPYIRGGGDGSYIDTGITPDNTTKVIVWARNFQPGGGNLFGSRTSASSNRFCLLTPGAANAGRIRIDYGDATDTYANDQFTNLSHYHKYELYQGVLKIDDVAIVSTGTQPTFSGTYNLYLLGNNNAGSLQTLNFPADICACQIYKGGTLVRDFTPVNSPSVGLYDAVSETVFTNAGSGTFSFGTFNQNAYTPLEYVTTGAGGSFFLTPAIGTYGLSVVAKVMATSNDAAYFDFCSGRDATNRFQLFVGNATNSCRKLSAILGTGTATDMASGNADGYFRNKELTFVKANNKVEAYYQNAKQGNTYTSSVNSSYSTGVRVCVGAVYRAESDIYNNYFVGNLYYFGFGDYNYVPAMVNNVAGFYDTYNDVFKPSESGTPFVAGPELNQ